ncbi:hypothetical protein [Marinoscillum sp.]
MCSVSAYDPKMGDHLIDIEATDEARLSFISHLLDDLKSLQYMLDPAS